jgi:tRNA modification GTPase
MRPTSESLLDTIAALATPMGRSAIAIVRLSGEKTRSILARVAPGLPDPAEPRRPYLTAITDLSGEPIDRGLVTLFAAPASFTGEDAAELSVHGSPVVVETLLRTLGGAGARPARAGEFTERAFRLGKIDLVEAEAIRDLIESRTEAAARVSGIRVEGGLSSRLREAREDLLAAAAGLTATIDFAEDVGERLDPSVTARLVSARDSLARLAASYNTGRLLAAGCRVAILGRPNAGKSTLFNALVGTARAIVTDVPGTTRDALEATVDVRGVPVELVDTAGLRETDDRVERIGVERAREEAARAAAILYVFDASAGWHDEDRRALDRLDGKSVTVIANKIDRTAASRNALGDFGVFGDFPTGSVPMCGLASDAGPKLRAMLERTVAGELSSDASSEVLGSLRQRDLVARAGAAAGAAFDALQHEVSHEYVATHLDDALAALADVFGETTSEDVIQRIFSTFCIGK